VVFAISLPKTVKFSKTVQMLLISLSSFHFAALEAFSLCDFASFVLLRICRRGQEAKEHAHYVCFPLILLYFILFIYVIFSATFRGFQQPRPAEVEGSRVQDTQLPPPPTTTTTTQSIVSLGLRT